MPIKVLKKKKRKNVTDTHLLVKSMSDYEVAEWDSGKIVEALRGECHVQKGRAETIAESVKKDIQSHGRTEIDVKTLKTFVNYHLFKAGYNGSILKGQVTLGMSLYDLVNLTQSKTDENSNISNNNPEAIAMTIAEHTNKQFALKHVFSKDVAQAHLEGWIHLHDLGQVSRVYCSAHSLRSIAMHGLGKWFNFDIVSSPAKHAQTLCGHLNTFLCSMATFYAGALGIDFVNIYFAPYVKGMTHEEMKQIAQYLIFSLSQSAFSRGGQVLFTDFNVHITVPEWLKKIQAVGPGGELLTKTDDVGELVPETYADYEETSQKFLKAMLDVWREGDANGMPFTFPKCDLHITKEDFKPENLELLEYACQVASENGSPYFVFDHNSTMLAACCRLRAKIDKAYFKNPERIRFTGLQNVTINLPQCAYRAKQKGTEVYKEINKAMDLAIKAHQQKKEYIWSIGKDPGSPMYEVIGREYFDGSPYIDLKKATYIIGLIGLNECVHHLTGNDLHESDEAYEMGKDVISHMYGRLNKYKEEHGLNFSLEESPAESTARRLAKVDMDHYPESAEYLNGSAEADNQYYSNSIHFKPDADITFLHRLIKQSEFHGLIESGAIVHLFCGENQIPAASILNLVKKTFDKTDCAQLCVSPEFTVCYDCHKNFRGLLDKCPDCSGTHVDQITRIVGYFSKIRNWNKSKKQELLDRKREVV